MKEKKQKEDLSKHPADCRCPLCAARRACRGLSAGFFDPQREQSDFRPEVSARNPEAEDRNPEAEKFPVERGQAIEAEHARESDCEPCHTEKRGHARPEHCACGHDRDGPREDGSACGCDSAAEHRHDSGEKPGLHADSVPAHTHGSACGCDSAAEHRHDSGEKPGLHADCVPAHTHGSACGCDSAEHRHDSSEERGRCSCGHDRDRPHENGCGCGCGHGETGGRAETVVFFCRVAVSAVLLALGAFLPLPEYVDFAFFIPAYLVIGYDVLFGGVKGLIRGKILDERLLMLIASVGAFAISEAPEGVLVMLLYQIGEFLTDLSLTRSQKSISALTRLRPEFAVVIRDGEEFRVAPEAVGVGETILVRPGERIPLDGVLRKGKTTVDTSALTGESVPVGKREGEEILSGSVNLEGAVEIETTKPFGASAVMRILELVSEAAEKKPKSERFIKKFARYYTPAVVIAAAALAVIPPLAGLGAWARWIHTALVFLVVSCPCALVIAVPLTYFAGVGGASKHGILVKGGAVFDALKNVKTAVFDKTGTLTEGVFEVSETAPADGVSEESLIAAVSAAESRSNHPIAKSIIAKFGNPNKVVSDYKELSGMGVSAVSREEEILAGNAKLMRERGVEFAEKSSGGSVVYVAADGKYLGAVVVSDRIKPEAFAAIADLKKLGVRCTMLTGDREGSAKVTAEAIGLDGYRAGLMPEDKVGALEELMSGSQCAFVGDGVNDAPVIMRADVGFAMGGMGQDAAIEAADVALMDDNPQSVAKSIKIARKTGKIAAENIAFALAVKAVVMVLGIVGIANMWLAVFADVGVTLLAVLNALRANGISS